MVVLISSLKRGEQSKTRNKMSVGSVQPTLGGENARERFSTMNTLVLDIGKTHVKLHVLNADLETIAVQQTVNRVRDGEYPSADVDQIWSWLCTQCQALTSRFEIHDLCITTHGATAALIDREASGDGLVLPICDYEFAGVSEYDEAYDALRADFAVTGSPALPMGLNLGRQLYWLSRRYPESFNQATDILMYPQYWVWRLTGQLHSEVTSLGCHTDLWSPWQNDFSPLVDSCGWRHLFAALAPAYSVAGVLTPSSQEETGLPASCRIRVGIHDSNGSYYRYKQAMAGRPFSVCSTGTWSIVMDCAAPQSQLDEQCDMLANVDLDGVPVVTSRFMGGREYALLCSVLGIERAQSTNSEAVARILASGRMILPTQVTGTGPFPRLTPETPPDVEDAREAAALASLYLALMLDVQLDLVGSATDIIVEGAFLQNSQALQLLAQLRAPQRVLSSTETSATIVGTALLAADGKCSDGSRLTPIDIIQAQLELMTYRQRWRERIAQATDSSALFQ